MRIAVIGMGNVGSVLGRRWAEVGHAVTFCVRDPEKQEKREAANKAGAAIGSVIEAAKAEVVLLAVPWRAVPETLLAAGELDGKVVLDCTNPVNAELTDLTLPPLGSSGLEVARLVPLARVVKIFNTNGAKNMAEPDYSGHKVSMFYAGDDAEANRIAADLAAQIGFEPIEVGPLKYSRHLEAMAMTWIILARHRGFGRDFAIDVVQRSAG
jgi:8-hydroxy-5-deazaflavin:NADPH oxidoreductase